MVGKALYGRIKHLFREILLVVFANKINACYLDIPAKKNKVNIFQYHPNRFYQIKEPYNLGDSLGEVIINFLLSKKGLDIDCIVSKTKHFNCVGTNIQGSYQNSTIWGSGIFPPQSKFEYFFQKFSFRKLDIRAVRGPLTRSVLLRYGHNCPKVYGDPAILLPYIYNPTLEKEYDYLVIPQFVDEMEFRSKHPNCRMISMNTNNYKNVIDEIVKSKVVYSSSLHGIILAETYKVPAIFFRTLPKHRDFKYLDYYYSTGRYDIKLSNSFEEAKSLPIPNVPDLSSLQHELLKSFPYDLWAEKEQ